MEHNRITGEIVDAALKVHSAMGPGLLENTYKTCMEVELHGRGLQVASEVELPVFYQGVRIAIGYRLDLLVEDLVIIEVKAVAALLPIHEAQLLSYLRLSGRRVGLLLNFNVMRMQEGIRRIVNNL